MNKIRLVGLIFLILLGSCEDNKKASQLKVESEANNNIKSSAEEAEQVQPIVISQPNEYPEITNENVVSFLTEFGINNPESNIIILTNHGKISIELFQDTPLHRANFIYLVKQGYFNNTFFHRVVKNFIIQGGNSDDVSTVRKRNAIGRGYLVPAEIIRGRNHTYGTVSGAKEYRENPDKKSAPFEFFIFLGPQNATGHLNGSYTIFGRVTEGMDTVEKIAKLPADDGDWPLQNVYIQNISIN